MAPQIKWTDEEVATLLRMRKEGHGPTPIGKAIGRTTDSVKHKIRFLRQQELLGDRPKPPVKPKAVKKEEPPPNPLRKREPSFHKHYAPLEYCENCHSPVSDWTGHVERLGWYGCRRPA